MVARESWRALGARPQLLADPPTLTEDEQADRLPSPPSSPLALPKAMPRRRRKRRSVEPVPVVELSENDQERVPDPEHSTIIAENVMEIAEPVDVPAGDRADLVDDVESVCSSSSSYEEESLEYPPPFPTQPLGNIKLVRTWLASIALDGDISYYQQAPWLREATEEGVVQTCGWLDQEVISEARRHNIYGLIRSRSDPLFRDQYLRACSAVVCASRRRQRLHEHRLSLLELLYVTIAEFNILFQVLPPHIRASTWLLAEHLAY
eukprot:5524889-Amphidinium_carterae.1